MLYLVNRNINYLIQSNIPMNIYWPKKETQVLSRRQYLLTKLQYMRTVGIGRPSVMCMTPSGCNTSQDASSHGLHEPSYPELRNVSPFINELSHQLLHVCRLVLPAMDASSRFIPGMLYWRHVGTECWPRKRLDHLLL